MEVQCTQCVLIAVDSMKTRYVYYIPVLDKILDFLQVGYLMKTKTGERERKRERGREREEERERKRESQP